uniref:Candidate secreted effector n=1 Tax=Meloidogyne incognita TaxID=6306 RepID=A0A914NM43_MELIC
MFWWIVLILLLILLTTLYFLFIYNSGISRCSSSEEIFDETQENNLNNSTKNKREGRNVFKSIYSNIMVKRSASLTSLPLLLRRRHSTVGTGFPKQVIRAAKKLGILFFSLDKLYAIEKLRKQPFDRFSFFLK